MPLQKINMQTTKKIWNNAGLFEETVYSQWQWEFLVSPIAVVKNQISNIFMCKQLNIQMENRD